MAYHIKIYHGDKVITDTVKPKYSDVEWAYTVVEGLAGKDWEENGYRIEYTEVCD